MNVTFVDFFFHLPITYPTDYRSKLTIGIKKLRTALATIEVLPLSGGLVITDYTPASDGGAATIDHTLLPGADATTIGGVGYELQKSPAELTFWRYFVTQISSTTASLKTPSSSISTLSRTTSSPGGSTSIQTAPIVSDGRKPQLGGGAIAGIVIGAVTLLLLLILGMFFVLRRIKQSKKAAMDHADDAPGKRESDKMVVDPSDAPFKDSVYPQELSGTRQVQELDPSKGNISAMSSNEPRADTRPGELSHVYDYDDRISSAPVYAVPSPTHATHSVEGEPSPHVQAQRRREVEWLEMEEIKLRQRREQLMREGQERTE